MVITILCDVIADVVDINVKMRPLTSNDKVLIRAVRVEKGWGANSPDLSPVDYSIWGALQQLVYRRRHFRDVEQPKEVLQTCWDLTGQDVIDHTN